ncbi:MAG: polysaccharide pyruvyl transferase family protein [Akkermansiaceae bacterium]
MNIRKWLGNIKIQLRRLVRNQKQRKVSSHLVNVFWWDTKPNFGDEITLEILNFYGIGVKWSEPERAQIVGLGSILQLVPDGYGGIVYGSGIISDTSRKPQNINASNFMGVRGKYTRDIFKLPKDLILGDPGLILCELKGIEKSSEAAYDLGIVIHYKHEMDKIVLALKAHNISNVKLISPCNSVEQVITEISSCKNILSSSLHGLIIADSLVIPSKWITFNTDLDGNEFKFHDYYSAFGILRSRFRVLELGDIDKAAKECELIPSKELERVICNVKSNTKRMIDLL